jgi:hypothetical protein
MKKVGQTGRGISLISALCCFWLTSPTNCAPRRSTVQPEHTACSSFEKGPITLYIHGTIFPVVARFTRHHLERKGLYRLTGTDKQSSRVTVGSSLASADPKQFPADSFYKYYWSGDLASDARRKAAHAIYALLATHEGPITIISHSHGCNVVLYLAELAKTAKQPLQIERLILLAPPVQEATAHLIKSQIFKRIYSFYSNADLMQVADPQGIYGKTKNAGTPFLSERTYADLPNLTQARILIHHKGPGHRDFIHPDFFKQIPGLIETLDAAHAQGKRHIIINIPPHAGKPHELTYAQERQPRGIDHCTCGGKHKGAITSKVRGSTSHHV